MAYRHRKKSKKTTAHTTLPAPMKKSQSAPYGKVLVDWPGDIEEKYVEEVKNRLDVIEQSSVTDDMVRAFLAANQTNTRHATEALKKCVEWRKGRQMFWNNYRSENERFQFLTQIRKVGRGYASTFGHTKHGRLLFYEKIGENFNMALHKEFTVAEFIDHLVVWCENLSNLAAANAGHQVHLIHEIPFYTDDVDSSEEEMKNGDDAPSGDDKSQSHKPSITPSFDDDTDKNGFPEIDADEAERDHDGSNMSVSDEHHFKVRKRVKKHDIKSPSSACKHSDVVGILDWKGLKVDAFLANKPLLLAAESLLSTYYPHLINRFYHINMPLDFEKIESELKTEVSTQTLLKSVFLESEATRNARAEYMKKYGRSTSKSSSSRRSKKKEEAATDSPPTDLPALDEETKKDLLEEIAPRFLPKEYGGDCDMSAVYTFVDAIYCSLVGVSSEPVTTGYEEFMSDEAAERKLWKQHALRSSDRHIERVPVKRGEHYLWQYTAEIDRRFEFSVTFEADGFRGKPIKVLVRSETEENTGYYPMFGDFIVLKDGTLIFQFKNVKGGKRMNMQYKIERKVFPQWFVNKHLPDYSAEERLLQSNTLAIGGKKRKSASQRAGSSTRTGSVKSGSTVLSTSPPPELNSLRVRSEEDQDKGSEDRPKLQNGAKRSRKAKTPSKKRSKTPEPPSTPVDGDDIAEYPNKKKRSVKQKKQSTKRARTPQPPATPAADD